MKKAGGRIILLSVPYIHLEINIYEGTTPSRLPRGALKGGAPDTFFDNGSFAHFRYRQKNTFQAHMFM